MDPNTPPGSTPAPSENKFLGVISNISELLPSLSPLLFIIRCNLLSKLSWLHKQSIAHKCAILALSLGVYLLFNWYVNRNVDTIDKSHSWTLDKIIRIIRRNHTASQDSPIEIVARWIRIGAYGLVPLTLLSIINHQDKLTQLMSGYWVVSVGIGIGLVIFLTCAVSHLVVMTFLDTLPLIQKITNAAEFTVSSILTAATKHPFVESHNLVVAPHSSP